METQMEIQMIIRHSLNRNRQNVSRVVIEVKETKPRRKKTIAKGIIP